MSPRANPFPSVSKGTESDQVMSSPPSESIPDGEREPVVILTELDSYIRERMRGQPRNLEEVVSRAEVKERLTPSQHRLTLPEFFESLSYDHTEKPGPFVFRWLFKEKRAIDRALNVLGWTLVNRTYFPHAPRYLFTANGGVEIGDAVLAFMPAKKAVEMRAKPARDSQERLAARVTQVEGDYSLMTGNPKDERIYKPELSTEAVEDSDTPVPGVLTEGRDL